jgi:hypothetical protein
MQTYCVQHIRREAALNTGRRSLSFAVCRLLCGGTASACALTPLVDFQSKASHQACTSDASPAVTSKSLLDDHAGLRAHNDDI